MMVDHGEGLKGTTLRLATYVFCFPLTIPALQLVTLRLIHERAISDILYWEGKEQVVG